MSTAVRDLSSGTPVLDGMIGHSPEMLKLFRMAAKVALARHPVLILGERGTGKETLARAIHSYGPSRQGPFVVVDCASLSPDSLRRELSGASLPEGVPGATLFLDEIAALPREAQSKLAATLQQRDLRSISNSSFANAYVRVIAGSSRGLEALVLKGLFRRDLYLQLNVVALRLPPLRERRDDIPALASFLLSLISEPKGTECSLTPKALDLLLAWDWPGNVRELESCLRAAASGSAQRVDVADLPPEIRKGIPSDGGGAGVGIVPLAEVEKQTILNALKLLKGDKIMTARLLGIGKTTLYRKLKQYNINGQLLRTQDLSS